VPFVAPPTAITGSVCGAAYTNAFSANDTWFNGVLPAPSGVGHVPISSGTSAAAWDYVNSAQIAAGAITGNVIATGAATTPKLAAGSVTLAKLTPAVQLGLAATGMTAWVRKASEIPAGWPRETNLDGRLPVGAGTEFSVTYLEDTAYGASWSHQHSLTDTSEATTGLTPNLKGDTGGWPASNSSHTHGVSGNTTASAWAIPMRAVVFVRKN
jgi:hypothetical protein